MAKTPRFCKILLHDALRQEKLGIPNRFAKRYGNYLKDKVFLKVPCGTKWQVELLKNDDGIWFEDGWNSFVDYYSLKHGSFLVFAVEDFTTCTFNAVIFDSTSEMHYPFPVNGDHEETNVEEQVHQPINRGKISEGVQQTRISEDKPPLPFSRCCGKMQLGNHRTLSEEIIETDVSLPRKVEEKSMLPSSSSRLHEKMKQQNGTRLPQRCKVRREGVLKKTQRLTPKDRAKALDETSSSCEPDDLSFSIVMKPTYLSGDHRMAIPISFANKYLKKSRGDIVLKSEAGKAWLVRYGCVYVKGCRVVRLCWRKFILDNPLEVGDLCVFEANDHNATELKVVICRGNKTTPAIGNKHHLNPKEIARFKALTAKLP